MPVLTSASAAERTSASVTCSAKWFQLFHPIGGVAATWLKAETAAKMTAQTTPAKKRIKKLLKIDYKTRLSIQPHGDTNSGSKQPNHLIILHLPKSLIKLTHRNQ